MSDIVPPYQGESTDPAARTQPEPQTETDDFEPIVALEGETYQFPSIHTDDYNYENCMVDISFHRENYEDSYSYLDNLEEYNLPGYEWRTIEVYGTTDASTLNSKGGDFLRAKYVWCDDNVVTDWEGIWDNSSWVTHVGTFTVSLNGTEYPGCQLFERATNRLGGYPYYAWYALVPKEFNGGLCSHSTS